MADYWKSTGKHYCEFCKCWTADNKVSIQFHEKGKNHQANVKKRLAEIKKNSIDKRKKDEQSKKMFEKMEKAALAAVQKDMNSSDITVGKSDMKNIVKAHAKPEEQSSNRSLTYPWQSMAGPQGTTYYYNSLTGESSWIMPEIFKKQREKLESQTSSREEKKRTRDDTNKSSASVSKDPYRAETKSKEVKPEEIRDAHPLLGGWTTVQSNDYGEKQEEHTAEEEKTTNSLDDESTFREEEKAIGEPADTGKRFKEKQLKTSIATSSEEPVAFKKRKFGNRNVRRRNEDD